MGADFDKRESFRVVMRKGMRLMTVPLTRIVRSQGKVVLGVSLNGFCGI